jgi:hypothetical protein
MSCEWCFDVSSPTNRPRRYISTYTIRPPNKTFAVKFYYYDSPPQSGRIVRPPKKWHSDLENLDGLSNCDISTHCINSSQRLWHFSPVLPSNFGRPTAVTKRPLIPGTLDPKKYQIFKKKNWKKNETSPQNPLPMCVLGCLVGDVTVSTTF